MKILIDENLPRKLAAYLEGHECRTVVECGWSGKKNGELLALADPLFDVLLTLDKNLPYQQNLDSVRVAVLIVRARSNRIQDLLPLLPECLAALVNIQPRQVVRLGALPPR
jgi:predicted nuclease of predicted toxin-antitoxin system